MKPSSYGASGSAARVLQLETQHVKKLDAILEYRLRVMIDEKITVNTRHPKSMPLVEGKLVAKCASAHLYPACAGLVKESNDPLQKRCATSGFLMSWLDGDAHQLVRAFAKRPNYACANHVPSSRSYKAL